MGPILDVHPPDAITGVDLGLSRDDRTLLDRLAKLWRDRHASDLGTRHQTGVLLNRRLGPPTARQSRGQKVLKLVAQGLGLAESELNRMRWFAHLFADLADLRARHPEIDSWTRFKAMLPRLKPDEGGRARKPAADPSRPAVRGVVRALTTLASKFNRLDLRPDEPMRQALVAGLRELAEAAAGRLQIRVEFVVE
jgi:hypothetical protein